MLPVRIGCSGWNYDDWRGRLYPEGLGKAAGSSATPRSSTPSRSTRPSTAWPRATRSGAGWSRRPPEFVFAAKASRYLTHVRRLREIETGIARYYERIEPLVEAGKLGPVVWQLPANFRARPGAAGGRPPAAAGRAPLLRVPPRELVPRRDLRPAARSRGGARDRRPSEMAVPGARAHGRLDAGPPPSRPPRPAGQLLRERARRVGPAHRSMRRRAEVLVYFNNDWEGFAVANARSLKRRLRS